ncbi:hypothetical protein HDU93_001061 [Gonapodya sp. JEL0774]|nr:hypothetical protein HDU93_001061 [Gonapodya sp. JEL0774]
MPPKAVTAKPLVPPTSRKRAATDSAEMPRKNYQWTSDKEELMVNWLLELENSSLLLNDTRKVAYRKLIIDTGLDCTVKQAENKMAAMHKRYREVRALVNSTGFGVDTDGSKFEGEMFDDLVCEEWRWYFEWDEVFGHRANIQPAAISEQGIVVASGQDTPSGDTTTPDAIEPADGFLNTDADKENSPVGAGAGGGAILPPSKKLKTAPRPAAPAMTLQPSGNKAPTVFNPMKSKSGNQLSAVIAKRLDLSGELSLRKQDSIDARLQLDARKHTFEEMKVQIEREKFLGDQELSRERLKLQTRLAEIEYLRLQASVQGHQVPPALAPLQFDAPAAPVPTAQHLGSAPTFQHDNPPTYACGPDGVWDGFSTNPHDYGIYRPE